ncbi:hypothetical protein [Neisseria sp. Ec49-e6-T10]|uniref:hypothetical protein n=1 Tax=Neisseria sp. Ec49-e6-T10 TaxID=3140744 RepID=UPI003EB9ED28
MTKIAYFYDEKFLNHRTGNHTVIGSKDKITLGRNFDNPEPLGLSHTLLSASGILSSLNHYPTFPATNDLLQLVHSHSYITAFQKACNELDEGVFADFDPLVNQQNHPNIICQHTEAVARLAVGAACQAVDTIFSKEANFAYVLSRAAGSHAGVDSPIGYSFYNSTAIAARYAQRNYQVGKIAIIDLGAMHANGVQEAFYQDEDVLTISIHQAGNSLVGKGKSGEVGLASAEGKHINIPLPIGSTVEAYKLALTKIVFPVMNEFAPDLVIVSIGSDAAFCDPMGRMLLKRESFYRLTKMISLYVEEFCRGRLIVLNGRGFSSNYTPLCVLGAVEGLLGKRTKVLDAFDNDEVIVEPLLNFAIDDVIKKHTFYWDSLSVTVR